MPFLDNNTSYAVYRFQLSGDAEVQVVTCGHEWASGSESLATHAAALDTAFVGAWDAQLSNAYTYLGVNVIGRDSGGTDFAVQTTVNNIGNGTQGLVPSNTAILIRKRSGLRGRRNRGRMYLPGVVDRDQVSQTGALAGGELTAMQTAATAWFNALDGATPSRAPIILHSSGSNVPTPVTAFTVDPVVATQRRRMRP